jgi:hypothetical protein
MGAIDPYPDDAGSAMLRDMLQAGAMQFWVIRSWADKALTTIVNGQVVLRGSGGLPPVDGWL